MTTTIEDYDLLWEAHVLPKQRYATTIDSPACGEEGDEWYEAHVMPPTRMGYRLPMGYNIPD